MKILFAVDLSEPEPVTRRVADLVRRLDAELLVLHVRTASPAAPPVTPVDPMSGLVGYAPYSVYDPTIEEDMRQAENDAFRIFLAERFDAPVHAATREGDPAQMIVEDADEEDADLIVLGKRHRSKLQQLLVGSVAGEVVRHSTRPVLLIPVLEKEEEESADPPGN